MGDGQANCIRDEGLLFKAVASDSAASEDVDDASKVDEEATYNHGDGQEVLLASRHI